MVGCYEVIRPQDKALEYNNRGLEALQQGDYENAIEQFSNDYKLPEARNNLGVVLKEIGETERARSEFRRAIKLNRDYAEPYFHLGIIAGEEGRWEEAKKYFEHALDIQPDFVEAGKNLGIVYLKLGMIEKSIRRLKITLENAENRDDIHDALGYAYFVNGEYNEALREFSIAIDIMNQNPIFYLHRGVVLLELSKMEEARSDFIKAQELNKGLRAPVILLALLNLKQGGEEKSINLLKKIKNSGLISENDVLIDEYTQRLLKNLEQ